MKNRALVLILSALVTYACDEASTQCLDTEHLFANKCEADDLHHCGSHTNNCTQISGWKSGNCIDKTCFADECVLGYHLASLFDSDNKERTICEEDTHDACGSTNTQCGKEEICTQGKCTDKCQPGEVICDGSCINPMTSRNFCGANAACNSYIACSEYEDCFSGKCVLSSCKNAAESLCTENEQTICVNIHGDNPNHCGACGAICSDKDTAKTNGCDHGQCTYICNNDMINCGSDTEPMCLPSQQLKNDPLHCGKCDTTCAEDELCQDGKCTVSACTDNACLFNDACVNQDEHCGTQCLNCSTANNASAGICQDGTCIITSCVDGYHVYNNTCEADSATDCGAHGTLCNVENATNTCTEGKCAFTCNEGYANLDDICVPAFISMWNMTANNLTVKFPIQGREGTITIDWGDGNTDTINSESTAHAQHIYSSAKLYTITVIGKINNWSCFASGILCGLGDSYCDQLVAIKFYGNTTFANYAFCNANKLESLPTKDTPRFTNNKMIGVFCGASKFNQNINFWDTSNITDMSFMFKEASSFNQPLNEWNTANVTNMEEMFAFASSFDQPLNDWNTSNVTNMRFMFLEATSFNHPLNNWKTSNVTHIEGMFDHALSFNQSLNNWDTSNVTEIHSMFSGATSFNQPLNNWNTANVTQMFGMFKEASSFNQPLNNWNTANVTNMEYMFSGASSFNQPLNNWNTANVTQMFCMFQEASNFNQPLNNWITSNVTNMREMFSGALSFNQQLDMWKSSKIADMTNIFSNSGLQKDNYCKLFSGDYAYIWANFKNSLGISYDCP